MPIKMNGYVFEGPFYTATVLEDRAGIYAILDLRDDKQYYVLDIGQSSQVKTRIENHDRYNSWIEHLQGILTFAVYYTHDMNEPMRMLIESELRASFNPPCGIR